MTLGSPVYCGQSLLNAWGRNCACQRHTTRKQGQTERANGVLEDAQRHFVGPLQQDWGELLAPVEFAVNNSWHDRIRNTPFMLNYGQNPDDPVLSNLRSLNPNIGLAVSKWSE